MAAMKSTTACAAALGRAESAGNAIARHSAAWRRGSRVTGVVRTVVGRPVAARAPSRSQVAWPARQRASSHDGR